jgi:hypothetical protein
MGDTIEVSRDAFEPITELVKLGLFKDEKEALKNLVLDQAAAKIRHFDSKMKTFPSPLPSEWRERCSGMP